MRCARFRASTFVMLATTLRAANPLRSAELRGSICGVARRRKTRDPVHQTRLGLRFRLPAGPVSGSGCWSRRALALAVVATSSPALGSARMVTVTVACPVSPTWWPGKPGTIVRRLR